MQSVGITLMREIFIQHGPGGRGGIGRLQRSVGGGIGLNLRQIIQVGAGEMLDGVGNWQDHLYTWERWVYNQHMLDHMWGPFQAYDSTDEGW